MLERPSGAQSTAETVERGARHSTALDRATRFGLVGYGFVHLLIAWVAIRIVVGGGDRGAATGAGALSQLTHDPLGELTLAALAAGFVLLAVWQVIAAAVGYRDLVGWRRLVMRLGGAVRVVTYAYLGLASARLLVHRGSGSSPRETTANVLARPAGVVCVAACGVVAACVGVGLMVFGARRQFLDQLDEEAPSRERLRAIVVVGQVGYVAKGAAFVIIGVVLCWAAFTHSPRKAGGLDQSFSRLLGATLGGPAVVIAGLGIGCFGLYLLARARHLDRRSLTS